MRPYRPSPVPVDVSTTMASAGPNFCHAIAETPEARARLGRPGGSSTGALPRLVEQDKAREICSPEERTERSGQA